MLRDEDAVLAQRAVSQGVTVVWREFEAMPHCFAMLLEHSPGAPVHQRELGSFCNDVVAGKKIETNGVFIEAKTLKKRDVDVRSGLTEIKDGEVEEYMRRGRERIERKEKRGQGEVEGAVVL
jgi:hypothetical protein